MLVFVLYINSKQVIDLYQHPSTLWIICLFLLYWIIRIWFLAQRKEIVIADRPSASFFQDGYRGKRMAEGTHAILH